jgi:RND family efflux transporter MFP subunit
MVFNIMSGAVQVLFVVVVGACLLGCNSEVSTDEIEFRVPVSVEEVGTGEVEDRIVATGTLRANEVVSLKVEVAGILEIEKDESGRSFAEGDRIKAGQVVAQVIGEDVRLAARTKATQQRYEAARNQHEANQRLFEYGLISKTELENHQSVLEDAKLEYDRSLQSEKRSLLTTPIDGVILRLVRDDQGQPFASGQFVTQGLEIAQIAPIENLIAEVDLVGPDVVRAAVGLTARVRHHAWENRHFSGTLRRLAPMIDPVTRAMRAEVEVENTESLLRPGMFVEVSIIKEQRTGVPVVPREAVTDRGGKWVVFVLKGQQVFKQEVALGLGDDEIVEIREGLQPGERIVTRGIETLTDQVRVRVTGS